MTSSSQNSSPLAASVVAATKSPALSIADAESDCPPSNDSPPLPPPVQRLGKFSIPCGSWSLLQLDPPHSIILHIGVVQLRIVAAGRWTPDEPEQYLRNPVEPPQPQPHESHQSYALRYLEWSAPCRTNPDWMRWNGRKAWSGQSVEELRDLLEADISVDNPTFLINPQQK
jgi:hypothetical protein